MHFPILLFLLLLLPGKAALAQRGPLVPYVRAGRWGYADSTGRLVIAPRFNQAWPFFNGSALVRFGEKQEWATCIIRPDGSYRVPPELHWDGKPFTLKKNDDKRWNAHRDSRHYGVIDSNGREIIPLEYEATYGSHDESQLSGYFHYDSLLRRWLTVAKKGGKFGVIDSANRVIIPFEYEGLVWPFTNFNPPAPCCIVVRGGKKGLVDTANRMIIPPRYDYVDFDSRRHPGQVSLSIGHRNIIADYEGKVIADIPGYSADYLQDSLIPVRRMNSDGSSSGRVGVMNLRHQLVIPDSFDAVRVSGDSIVVLKFRSSPGASWTTTYRRIFSRKNFQPLSGWYSNDQGPQRHPVPPSAAERLEKARRTSNFLGGFIRGDTVWLPTTVMSGGLTGVAALCPDTDKFCCYAVVDSQQHLVLAPRASPERISVLNGRDHLLVLRTDTSSRVTDLEGHLLIRSGWLDPGERFGSQKPRFETAFRHKGQLYVVAWLTDRQDDNVCILLDSTGRPAPRFRDFTLLHACDSFGAVYGPFGMRETYSADFLNPELGWFMVRGADKKKGIVNVDGDTSCPAVSFVFQEFRALGYGFFITERRSKSYGPFPGIRFGPPESAPPNGIYRREPWLVDARGRVLLDSMTVREAAWSDLPGDAGPLLLVSPRTVNNDFYFYMDLRGRGYFDPRRLR